MTHTPTPWVCHSGMVWRPDEDVAFHGDGIPIARMDRETPKTQPTERDANAHFIVRAVNSHADLVRALTRCQHALSLIDDFPTASGGEHPNVQNQALDMASNVLANV